MLGCYSSSEWLQIKKKGGNKLMESPKRVHDFEFPSSMLENSEEALFPFVEKIKVLEEEKLTGHLIMELVGADISLLRANDIAVMIAKKMEEVLENRGSVAEPAIDFGLNVASIENRKGELKARLLLFIGRFTD